MIRIDPFAARTTMWIALAVAIVPVIASHVAYALSIRDGLVPACVPYWDGCTSISRAARHGEGNLLFKVTMLPLSVLLGLLWWRAGGLAPIRGRWLRALGLLAALALAVYVAFLGSEGGFSRWLRRYGALIYFASNYLAMIVWVRAAHRAGLRDPLLTWLAVICTLLLLFGLCSVAASTTIEQHELKDRIENAIEWTLGALFTLWFLGLAAWLKRCARGGLMRVDGDG